MVQQLFDALFMVSLGALAAAPIVGGLLLVWPRRKTDRTVRTQVHAHA